MKSPTPDFNSQPIQPGHPWHRLPAREYPGHLARNLPLSPNTALPLNSLNHALPPNAIALPRLRPHSPSAFTLVELMVVILIIAVLMAILIPTVASVRRASYGAKTQSTLSQLAAAIEAYHTDYRAYPGPIQTSSLYMQSTNIATFPAADKIYPAGGPYTNANALLYISQTQNLTLGLSGGLAFDAANNAFVYDPTFVGKGPRTLATAGNNVNRLGKGAYVENVPMSQGKFSDEIGFASDSVIPVYLDGYSRPLPLLYLRARTGAPGVIGDIDGILGTATAPQQYDIKEIIGYTSSGIGEGKDTSKKSLYSVNGALTPGNWPSHGLRTISTTYTTVVGSASFTYPYDAYPYLGNPSFLTGTTFSQPRQKDGFILISAGPDRIYGTEDDICNFGSLSFAK